jgi:hypothetical protein
LALPFRTDAGAQMDIELSADDLAFRQEVRDFLKANPTIII